MKKYSKLKGQKAMSREEEQKLFLNRDSQESIDRIVGSCLNLVHNEAQKINTRSDNFDDLVQEGVIGLLAAIAKYDCTKGTRFITYATFWIRKHIISHVKENNNCIRVPGWVPIEKYPSVISLDAIDPDTEGKSMGIDGGFENLINEECIEYVLSILNSEKHKNILIHSYGLLGNPIKSMSSIARDLGIGRNEVYIQKKKAIAFLNRRMSKEMS